MNISTVGGRNTWFAAGLCYLLSNSVILPLFDVFAIMLLKLVIRHAVVVLESRALYQLLAYACKAGRFTLTTAEVLVMGLLVGVHISYNALPGLHTGLCKVIAHVGLPLDPWLGVSCIPPSYMHFCFPGNWRGCWQDVVYTCTGL